jgi:hypothetical protein
LFTQLHEEISTLKESTQAMTTQVNSSLREQKQTVESLELRCNQRCETITSSQHTQLQEFGKTLLTQIKDEQTAISSNIKIMRETQEYSLEQKMNRTLQSILSEIKIQPTNQSHTQKKIAIHSTKEVQTLSTMDDHNNTQHPTETQMILDELIPFTNPYNKSSIRRRSVHNTLSATEI